MAGLFFAFSVSVMNALARIPPAQGILAMQTINIAIVTPVFLLAFLGTAVASIVLAICVLLSWETPGAGYLLLGSALYLIGDVGVTFAFNVPRNDALAAVEPSSAEAASLWAGYVPTWTAWNHVRTLAALAATAAFILAIRAQA